ncbi:glycosyltransferase family 2 protein [Candidatus Methylacidithermus pantelleriae]|uniref:Glycosyl transferase n=1 Tax=Candidatus Methylacidithermus pantelleriae TaxID=2744239 RepID=A0A8J2FNS1_9BACT|nr:glycosyltransferase family 2 protein [Candidatus Methylacidithermus pantelleriae]CAF0694698.1 Glycosyl transferase [Candidatus Methylacidithermus pantelleriae]
MHLDSDDGPFLSVVIPVFNEQATVGQVIDRVLATPWPKEIVVVDDGSTDGTWEVLQKWQGKQGVRLFRLEKNQGKGAALRFGFSQVTGKIILVQDADLEYDPADYALLLEPILEGKADVVYGTRFHGGPRRVLYFWHAAANRFLTTVSNMITNLNLSDMEVGYKVFRREILQKIRLRSNRFAFEPEVTVKVAKLGCRIWEVPISYSGRTYAEGKKIRWWDGIAALSALLYFRFFD